MLNRLKIENFKAWREADLTLGKVTGLFGTNSAGKSSLLQFLLLLKQTRNATDRGIMTPTGDPARGFEELPQNTFDPSDRKFLAVAVAADAVVLNATDSDWGEQGALMGELGVEVRELCPQHASRPVSRGRRS